MAKQKTKLEVTHEGQDYYTIEVDGIEKVVSTNEGRMILAFIQSVSKL